MTHRLIQRLILAATFSAFTFPAAAEKATVPIADDFNGFGYSITSSGKVVVFAAPREMGGKLVVCGLVYFEDATSTTRAIERQFTEQIRFVVGGQPVKVLTDMFIRYKSQEEATAANKAGCAVTNKAWDPAFAQSMIELSMGRVTVRH